jgi:hypothetical protein
MFDRLRRRGRDAGNGSGAPTGDPGPSPVPWLSDEIWRAWNAGDSDACSRHEPGRPIDEVWPTFVTEDDRRRSRPAPIPPGAPVPAPGTLEEHATLLRSTPGTGYFNLVLWPVCCDRPTTLLMPDIAALESAVGPLDVVLTEAHHPSVEKRRAQEQAWADVMAKMRAGKHGGDGTAFFQCRACGRIYGACCEP